jgi:hypothetical protein
LGLFCFVFFFFYLGGLSSLACKNSAVIMKMKILQTVGRAEWMEAATYTTKYKDRNSQEIRASSGFQLTDAVFERANIFYALDRTTIVIGIGLATCKTCQF